MDIDRRTSELRDRAARYAAIYTPIRERLMLSWIYYDQAIEGVALTLPEINGALAGQHRPANDRATEHTFRVIRNLKTAFAWVDSQAALDSRPRIDDALVRTLHGIVVDGDPDTVAGSYRAEIPLHRAYFHEIMLPKAIPEAMAKIHEVLEDPELQQQHPIRQAATLHFDLMRIFPFTDHSGTVCRLIAEIILRRHGYPALVIPAVDRQRYYEALRDNVEKLN
ncbi:MAG: Fic family protein, partial [Planctomycetes bacterium]|nr:Fic family protein [Planctomycetota bacterium]